MKNIKFKPTDKIEVKMRGERYERYGSGGHFKTSFKGTAANVLKKMMEVLHYEHDDREEDGSMPWTLMELFEELDATNGDGCDFISELTVKKGARTYKLIDETDGDDDYDCD